MNPTQSAVHIDAPLTNISVAYMQKQTNFVARRAFPAVSVVKISDKYFVFDKNDFLRDDMQRRGDAQPSAGSGYRLSTVPYNCDVWALHKDVSDRVRANSDSPLNPDRNATQWLTQQRLLRQEIQWVSDYFKTGVWADDVTPGTLWSDYASSDPIDDVELGKETILKATGFEPNRLILGYQVWRKLKQHPDVIDRFKHVSSASITTEMMAGLFEIDQVLVAKAVKATNVEGETAAYDFTHGKHALLCHAADAPGLEVPSCGYTFEWEGISQGLGETVGVSSFRMNELKADRIEIEAAFDNKVVATDLGYFFNAAVA